jgi:hypothetical protein
MTQPANDLTQLKKIVKHLLEEMGTVIKLISALINKKINGLFIKDCSREFQPIAPRLVRDKAIYSNL